MRDFFRSLVPLADWGGPQWGTRFRTEEKTQVFRSELNLKFLPIREILLKPSVYQMLFLASVLKILVNLV